MGSNIVGISISAPDAATALSAILEAEEMGIQAVWLTSGSGGGDPLTLFAAAAAQTQHILLGSSIVQTWSRHPVTIAQQVQVIAALAPARFRLGVGPGHKPIMENNFDADFKDPLSHLVEYIRVLKALFMHGTVDLDGKYFKTKASISQSLDVPVMASALQTKSFRMCGAETDGAISWVTPHQYLEETALPALRKGAEIAGRPTPPLIAHVPISVHEDPSEVYTAVRKQLGPYPKTTFYSRMFAAAGFPESDKTGWTDKMVDSVAIYGNENEAAQKLEQIFKLGASEVLATVVGAGDDIKASTERTLRLLATFQ